MQSSLVVGSGFGGIASALRLRSLGFEVHVIERQDDLGGRAQYSRSMVIDTMLALTVITAPFLFDELLSYSVSVRTM